jgi:hypothetical protein
MQRLDQLWKVLSFAGQVRDIAIESKHYQFAVQDAITFYVDTEHSSLEIGYHTKRELLIDAEFQAGFGWRVQTEQDAAGIYLVAKRKAIIGSVSTARFSILLPTDTYTILRLESCSYRVKDVTGEVHLPALKIEPK